jgi:hypothetical protein
MKPFESFILKALQRTLESAPSSGPSPRISHALRSIVCGNCGGNRATIRRLKEEQAAADVLAAASARRSSGSYLCFDSEALSKLNRARPIWFSASPDDANAAPKIPQSPNELLRDALGQFSRVFFERASPLPVVTTWDKALTPLLLDVAGRFGQHTQPLVWVFMTAGEMSWRANYLKVADWRRATIVQTTSTFPPPFEPGGPPRDITDWESLNRAVILKQPMRAVIFFGSGDNIKRDADASANLKVPKFAVGSTGALAAILLNTWASSAPYDRSRELLAASRRPGSYLELALQILTTLEKA